jgi:hypothetical protein
MAEVDFDQGLIDQGMSQIDEQNSIGNPRFAQDANLYVRFFYMPHPDKKATQEQGRPIYYDREYVEIMVPGDKGNIVNRPARDMDRARFARQYRAFKNQEEQNNVGTPLDAWPGISRAQVEELRYFKISTVEQLATVPDNIAQKFMGINKLKNRAKVFIEAAKGMAQTDEFRAEIAKKDSQINALTEAVRELRDLVAESRGGAVPKIAALEDDKPDVSAEEVAEDPEDR